MTPSMFHAPWWLEAVTDGQWFDATVEADGSVLGRLPYAVSTRRIGGLTVRVVGSPPLTPRLGPVLDIPAGKSSTRLSREQDVLAQLLAQLPPFDWFSENCLPGSMGWLPVHWMGLSTNVRYSFVLDEINDLDAVWKGFSDTARRAIRKAERSLEVEEDDTADRLWTAISATFARQGMTIPFTRALLDRVVAAVGARDAGRTFTAVDSSGRAHASMLVVWGDSRAYYLTGGADPELRSSGAQSLLMWHAIKASSGHVPVFDFEGSMIESIARFFRTFGGRPEPYVQLVGTSRRGRIGLAAREIVLALRNR